MRPCKRDIRRCDQGRDHQDECSELPGQRRDDPLQSRLTRFRALVLYDSLTRPMSHPCRSAAGDCPDEHPRERVDDDGHQKERETDLDEGAPVGVVRGLAELVGDDAGHAVARSEQVLEDLAGRLPMTMVTAMVSPRARPKPRMMDAYDADARVAKNAHADHLPARGSEGEHGFTLRMRNCGHDLARERRDDGQDHDGEDHSGGKHTDAEVGLGEEATPSEELDQNGIDMLAQDRHQHEDGPDAVDDAGNRGQQLGEESENAAQHLGAHLGNEDGDAHRQRDCDDERNQGGSEGSVNERQRAEVAVDRVPCASEEKLDAEFGDGELGANDQFGADEGDNGEDAESAQHHQPTEALIGEGRAAARLQKFPNRRRFVAGPWPIWLLSYRRGRFKGSGHTNFLKFEVHQYLP